MLGMENRILADTSVLIALQRRDPQAVSFFRKHIYKIDISRISACEFIYGSRNKGEKNINKDFLEWMYIIEIDENISERAFEIIDEYGLKVKMGVSDALIAATALEENMKLWTLNQKHFKEIKNVELI
ncbi:PIN domain-containing protein [candidate division WWE3 bacterium]|nr:PIN domain-containing protein [candidate division WWE3 bacterium]